MRTHPPAPQPVLAEPAPATPPAPAPAPPPKPEDTQISIDVPDRTRWYYAEQYDRGADPQGFRATFDRARNKIDVQTAGATQFVIDTSRVPIDWERLVVLGIDGRNSELRRRDFDLLRFKRDEYGQWVVVEP